MEHGPAEPARDRRTKSKGSGRIVARYAYRDEQGNLLFEVCRFDPKSFRQRRPASGEGWAWSLGDVRRVLYRLPELIANPSATVFIAEGEKAAEALRGAGLTATCSPGGAGKWRLCDSSPLAGRNVVILPDHDQPGRDHAEQVARSLHGRAESVRILDLPGLPPKGDPFDWLAAGGSAEQLVELAEGAPSWEPAVENVQAGGSEERPDIQVTADLHLAVDAIAAAFPLRDDVFRRGDSLVMIQEGAPPKRRQPTARPDDVAREDIDRTFAIGAAPIVTPLTVANGRVELSRSFRFSQYDRRARDWLPIAPPMEVVAGLLGRGAFPNARDLVGVVESPTIRPDGSILSTPGYDAATGLLYAPSDSFPAIPERPTTADVKRAVDALGRVIQDFPFADDSDRGAWLAYALTVVCRPAVDGPVPMTMFSANVAGSGKTYLASVPCLIATGRPPAMDGYSDDNAEMEKRLVALALAGDPVVIWDNADSGAAIGGAALDRSLSADGAFRGRVLGQSKLSGDSALPWRTVQAITGNGLATRSDARRRVVPCYLRCPEPRPERRPAETFALYRETGMSVSEYVQANRPELVAACLTIVRGFIVAGRPRSCHGAPMGDPFHAWDALIRQAVAWATGWDALGGRVRLDEGDETTQQAESMAVAWGSLCAAMDVDEGRDVGYHAARGVSTAEAAEALSAWQRGCAPGSPPSHVDVLRLFSPLANRGASTPDARTLGYALRKVVDMVTSEGVIECRPPQKGVRLWTIRGHQKPSDDGGDGGDGVDVPAQTRAGVKGKNTPHTQNGAPCVTLGSVWAETSQPSPPSPPSPKCGGCMRLDCRSCNP